MQNVQQKSQSTLAVPEIHYNVELSDKLFEPKSLAR